MVGNPVGPSVDVSPAGVKAESLRRRSRQLTQSEQVNGRVLKQTRH